MKRTIACITVLVLILVAFAGCEKNTVGNTAATAEPAAPPSQQTEATEAPQQAKMDFPQSPITLVVPWASGGGTDMNCRMIASLAEPYFGKPVVVVNREGAGATIGTTETAKANPDGYTIQIIASGIYSSQPFLREVEYTIDDFDFLLGFTLEPYGLFVNQSLGVENVADFIQYTKDSGKTVMIGTHSAGSLTEVFAKQAMEALGLDYSVVNYDGDGQVLAAMLSGEVTIGTCHPFAILSNIQAGTIVGIGSSTEERFYDDMPTLKEQGYDVQIAVYKGFVAPAGLDPAVKDFIAEQLKNTIESDEFQKFAAEQLVPVYVTSGDALKEAIVEQTETMRQSFGK